MRKLKIYSFSVIFLLLNCNKTTSTEPQNSPPVISQIMVEPEQPRTSQVVKLISIASDADKHELHYRWSASRGALTNDGIGNPIHWSTPGEPGNVTIVSMVYDGIELVTKSIGVDVIDFTGTDE